jgi:acyl-CoA thioester hydrolase
MMATPDRWPDLSGRLDGDRHILPVRVYFEDTDFSGFVYHGSYIRFMERGRSDFVRLIGIGHGDLNSGVHGEPLVFAVRRIDIEYRKPARIDDVVEVETRAREIRGASIVLAQTIRRGDDVLTEAIVTVALVNRDGKPRRIPDSIRRRFSAETST